MKVNILHSPYLLIFLSSLALHASSPQTVKSDASSAAASSASPDGAAASVASAAANPTILATLSAAGKSSAQQPPLDRRTSAPPVPQLNLQAVGQASQQLSSPPSNFSLDGMQQPPLAPHSSGPRRPSLSSGTGSAVTYAPYSSPALKPLQVSSPPNGAQPVVVHSAPAPQRRGSTASPSLRPMAAPTQKSSREMLEASQFRLATYATKVAGELSTLKLLLQEVPLSPRSRSVVEKDIELCDDFAPAADYLMLPFATKKKALPTNKANAIAKAQNAEPVAAAKK